MTPRSHVRTLVGYVAACMLAVGLAACHHEFDPKVYASNPDALFAASLNQLMHKHWEGAAAGFEQLTHDLPARDPLLPRSYYYLGDAQEHQGNHLLAAQSFTRLAESFPDDSLAPQALLEGGRAYGKMWRRPDLDAQYGVSAQTTLQSLVNNYPDSKLVPAANTMLAHLDNELATKDLRTGEHYLRRGAFDSSIIYFKDVIKDHPTTPAAKRAYARLVEAYRAIRYTADARDTCDAMAKAYPNDREVRDACGSVSSAAASTPRT